ncbi:MAG: hypothetical protein QOJ19_3891 [Acidimicrobiia bacterium]|jgi:hypothetical protein|nr:hypothetical protein [Acidimicrobiia bacterium]
MCQLEPPGALGLPAGDAAPEQVALLATSMQGMTNAPHPLTCPACRAIDRIDGVEDGLSGINLIATPRRPHARRERSGRRPFRR